MKATDTNPVRDWIISLLWGLGRSPELPSTEVSPLPGGTVWFDQELRLGAWNGCPPLIQYLGSNGAVGLDKALSVAGDMEEPGKECRVCTPTLNPMN